ncbi:glycosyltransferase [Chryseobacterium sp. FH1]|uniref:glycosyltransferase n=1 Tax=Chryseobacterium sp. FH1 TaxID=1233951 RepID=UPI0004E38272|nr:glycosyltransferase [Chryseobacterium sp. FH1]KFC24065.1 hypothetical protein IO90_01805 [Chryseobacterium sp. FH1]
MLSIIISSYQEDYYKNVCNSISQTIGNTAYEIIKIENPGLMGVCEAYNKGAAQSKHDYLLFIHEDILFQTDNWGEKLISHFSKLENPGILAVAGTSYKSIVPVGWWSFLEHRFLHLDQITKEKETHSHRLENPKKVIITDGVFLAMTKEKWAVTKFNDNNKDFHGYDVEISLDFSKNSQNYVIPDILITHLSSGTITRQWLDRIINIYSKHIFKPSNFSHSNELSSYEIFFRYLNRFKYSKSEKIAVFFKFYRPLLFSLRENYKILHMFFYYINTKN